MKRATILCWVLVLFAGSSAFAAPRPSTQNQHPARVLPKPTGRLIVKLAAPAEPLILQQLAGDLGFVVAQSSPGSPYITVTAKPGRNPLALKAPFPPGIEWVEREIPMSLIEPVKRGSAQLLAPSSQPDRISQAREARRQALPKKAPPDKRAQRIKLLPFESAPRAGGAFFMQALGEMPAVVAGASSSMDSGTGFSASSLSRLLSVPGDPYYRYQWGLQESTTGIGLPSARNRTKGEGVRVAVIDTGIRRELPDLAGTKILQGYNALTNKPGAVDDNGHGTHVTGTIAQATDNGVGCAGIAPACEILPVKVLAANGMGSNLSIATGIRWAVDQGAKVINLSVGGVGSRTLQDAIDYAAGKGVVVVASAGNSGKQGLSYPAAYGSVISVGATTNTGVKASFSQYGNGLTLVAPGQNIINQTFKPSTGQNGYFYFSGTSMAAPHVTGVSALLLALNRALTIGQVRSILTSSARDLGAVGYDTLTGAGLVDAAAACAAAATPGGPVSPPPTTVPVTPIDPVPSPAPAPAPSTDVENAVLNLVNAERLKAGVPPLALHPQLVQAAAGHAAYQASTDRMSHTGAGGSNPGQRITAAGYPWRTWGENVASGYPDPQRVMAGWMGSPGHRANILSARFSEMGIARAAGGSRGPYWAQCFGAR